MWIKFKDRLPPRFLEVRVFSPKDKKFTTNYYSSEMYALKIANAIKNGDLWWDNLPPMPDESNTYDPDKDNSILERVCEFPQAREYLSRKLQDCLNLPSGIDGLPCVPGGAISVRIPEGYPKVGEVWGDGKRRVLILRDRGNGRIFEVSSGGSHELSYLLDEFLSKFKKCEDQSYWYEDDSFKLGRVYLGRIWRIPKRFKCVLRSKSKVLIDEDRDVFIETFYNIKPIRSGGFVSFKLSKDQSWEE